MQWTYLTAVQEQLYSTHAVEISNCSSEDTATYWEAVKEVMFYKYMLYIANEGPICKPITGIMHANFWPLSDGISGLNIGITCVVPVKLVPVVKEIEN